MRRSAGSPTIVLPDSSMCTTEGSALMPRRVGTTWVSSPVMQAARISLVPKSTPRTKRP